MTKYSKSMPYAASDFTATYLNAPVLYSEDKKHKRSIVLIGGCAAENGNEWMDDEFGGGYYCTEFSKRAVAFFPENGEFKDLPELPGFRSRHSAVTIGKKIFVIGGRDEQDNVLTDVLVFDSEVNTWFEFMTLDDKYASSDHASVVHEGEIYVFGGYDAGYGTKSTAFKINIEMKEITDLEPMEHTRGDIAAVTYDYGGVEGAFIIGGFSGENNWCEPFPTVQLYNYDKKSWTTSHSLKSERGDKAAVVIDKTILAVGGEDKHEDYCSDTNVLDENDYSVAVDDVEALDPRKNDGWAFKSKLPEIRFRASAALDEKSNTVYFFGGQKSHDSTCNCYKTASDIFVYEGHQGLGGGAVAGIAIGSIVGAGLIGFLLMKGRKGRGKEEQSPGSNFGDDA